MLAPVRLSISAIMPVTLADAKAHVGAVGFTDDDPQLEGFIKAAVGSLERTLTTALVDQSWRQDLGCWSTITILRPGPVIDVSSVKYVDESGEVRTLPASSYGLFADVSGYYLQIFNRDLPRLADRPDAISVIYSCGFDADTFPPELKTAILLHVGLLFSFRGDPQVPRIEDNSAYQALIWPYRKPKV
ncbi:head-tail connector protein [Brucella anthropi]|uniref:head-tail connector protein n=1 Tax=Brucella anthropi TaxID=529 RepID=UPI00124D5140|nr:hypothetical protein [Brucella anthropi]KAB2748041.1 hypothetical protein F9L05_15550 [Brucella anthropi]